jgi:hypothetical protein
MFKVCVVNVNYDLLYLFRFLIIHGKIPTTMLLSKAGKCKVGSFAAFVRAKPDNTTRQRSLRLNSILL